MEKKKFGEVQSKESSSPFWLFWNNLELGIGVFSIGVVTVLAFCNVIARYIIGSSILWSEEVCKFFMIWMTFGGAAYAFRLGVNIGVTFFVDKLPPKPSFWFGIVSKIIIIGFFMILVIFGFERVVEQMGKGQVSTAARIPMFIPFSALPIGSVLVVIRIMQQIVSDISEYMRKGGETL